VLSRRQLLAAALLPAPTPAFTLTLLDGGEVNADRLLGRPVVLNFWATWCAPCRRELAELDALAAAHPRLAAFAVLAERRPDPRLLARQRASIRLPVATRIGPAGAWPLVGGGVPTTYILDHLGRVAARKGGAYAPGALTVAVLPLLTASDSGR
jgi:thiol-disulfide isomerase/thioredoxin